MMGSRAERGVGVRRRFSVRDIARQAGLSEATVDRVLNERPGVRAGSVEQVRRAVDDLERQQTQVRLTGRTAMFDLVMAAPPRFCDAVRSALEAEIPSLHPATVRVRFHQFPGGVVEPLEQALDRVLRTGSHGVLLQAPDLPGVRAAVEALERAQVPVVTLASDLPGSPRRGYVGADNRGAGATAAYLLSQWLGEGPGEVLVVRGGESQHSEEERAVGFARTLAAVPGPRRRVVEVRDDPVVPQALEAGVVEALAAHPDLRAVYSMSAGAGGNATVLRAFERSGLTAAAFVAHDLDGENADLLREGRLSAVLHHDLGSDCRRACQILLRAPYTRTEPARPPSAIQIVTRFNLPTAR